MRLINRAVPVPKLNGWLLLEFDNGERKLVDIKPVMKGSLAQLKDMEFFNRVTVDDELGTITWPRDLDLDPDNLYNQGIEIDEIKKLAEILNQEQDQDGWLERA
ncbi:DUF2442 domain-containing protein [Evansella tamaricis]|uniref:DUF2442 domain-containing protein n=1 Tax=Evansella tamaricis TaxID=2069301 RepID=A0ABS6JDE0_9BACI|nr:DUF2442 domain-containing protein [Evansella tamaricis]MBU9711689.1 DUF2442 domain-containing protein [Evansella tamaricis]